MIRQSKQHVAAAGEGDGEHFRFTTAVGRLAIAAELVPVRALLPLCTRTGSTIIARRPHPVAGRGLLEQIAEQSAGAITFVGPELLSAVVGAAPVVPRASFVSGMVGPLAFAIALTFLPPKPELASVHAPA